MTIERMNDLLSVACQEGFLLEIEGDPFEIDGSVIEWIFAGRNEKVAVKLIFIQSSNYGGVYVALSDAAYLVVDEVDEIYFEKIAYPLLFLPFVSRASEIIGKRIFIKLDDKEFLLNFNNNIYSNFFLIFYCY